LNVTNRVFANGTPRLIIFGAPECKCGTPL
jgi:hypothetical protein